MTLSRFTHVLITGKKGGCNILLMQNIEKARFIDNSVQQVALIYLALWILILHRDPCHYSHNERDSVPNHRLLDFCTTVCSGEDQRTQQSSTSLAFVRGILRWPMNSPHKWPVKQKMFPFDDIIMKLHCLPVVLRPIYPLWIYCIHHKGIHFNFRYCSNMFGASSQFVWIFMAYTFPLMWYFNPSSAVHVPTWQWHHNRRDGISNHQHLHCSLNRLFRRRSKKTSKEYILRKLVYVHAHTYIF